MKNSFGSNLTVTILGESHKEAIGCVIDGIAPGIPVDLEYINSKMMQRASSSDISTPRRESDTPRFISGVKDGFTEGTPILILVDNENINSAQYEKYSNIPRPGHADLTAEYKYHGFQDKRGGGHFSGRVTSALVAAGALIRYALEKKGIFIGTHIKELKGVSDRCFIDYKSDIKALNESDFPALDKNREGEMKKKILEAKNMSDSVGGILETAVIGMPKGIGEPWFDSCESLLAHGLFSIPAIKGVEFGDGFAVADMYGSESNDEYEIRDGNINTCKNTAGGILGGITNGETITFKCAVKPTPSIGKIQKSVDIEKMENTTIEIEGRHDPSIIHRARAVVDAVTAIVLADLLTVRYGTDYLSET